MADIEQCLAGRIGYEVKMKIPGLRQNGMSSCAVVWMKRENYDVRHLMVCLIPAFQKRSTDEAAVDFGKDAKLSW